MPTIRNYSANISISYNMSNTRNYAAGDISINHNKSNAKNYAAGDISISRAATLGEENINS